MSLRIPLLDGLGQCTDSVQTIVHRHEPPRSGLICSSNNPICNRCRSQKGVHQKRCTLLSLLYYLDSFQDKSHRLQSIRPKVDSMMSVMMPWFCYRLLSFCLWKSFYCDVILNVPDISRHVRRYSYSRCLFNPGPRVRSHSTKVAVPRNAIHGH